LGQNKIAFGNNARPGENAIYNTARELMQRQAEENVLPPEMSSKGSITPRQVGTIPAQERPEPAKQQEEAKYQKLTPAAAPSRISRASRAQAALRVQASQQHRDPEAQANQSPLKQTSSGSQISSLQWSSQPVEKKTITYQVQSLQQSMNTRAVSPANFRK
jgi:hypothetical protein